MSRLNIKTLSKDSLFRDSFWALLGKVLGSGLSLLAGIVVARFLGKDVYGEYGMVKTTLVQAAMFSTFGLGYTITKYVATALRGDTSCLRSLVRFSLYVTAVFSGIISILLCVFSDKVAVFLGAPHLSSMLRLSAFAIFFNAITTTQIGALAGLGRFRDIALNNTYAGIMTFVMSVVLTYYYGLDGSVIALSLSLLFNSAINGLTLHKCLKQFPARRLEREHCYDLLKFSLPVALQESSYSVIQWLVTYVLIHFASYGELGLYNAATQWSALIAFLPGVLRNVMLSHLSSEESGSEQHHAVLRKMLLLNVAATLIPAFVVMLLSDFVCSFYGPTFIGLKQVLCVAVFSSVFTAVMIVFQQEFISAGRNWLLFFVMSARDIAIIVVTVLLIRFVPGKGAAMMLALTSLFAYMLDSLILYIVYKRQSSVCFKE